MDIRNLQYFIAVAEHLSFSRAAQSLFISQPSLSIRISALEEELGVKLFRRAHQKVFLTTEGVALLPAAREIIEKVNSLQQVVRNAASLVDEMPKELVLGFDSSEDRNLPIVDNPMRRFRQSYPGTEIRVVDVTFEDYAAKLINGEIDLAVVVLEANKQPESTFLSIPLLTERVVIAASNCTAQQATNLSELIRTHEVQMLKENNDPHHWNDLYMSFLRKYDPEIKPVYVKNASVLRMNLVHSNIIAFLPQTFLEDYHSDKITLIPIDLPRCNVALTLVWNKFNINPTIQLIINEFISEQNSNS